MMNYELLITMMISLLWLKIIIDVFNLLVVLYFFFDFAVRYVARPFLVKYESLLML
jgi:hypothetical protein